MTGGQFAFTGSALALQKTFIESGESFYVGLLRKRGEPTDEINDETTMSDIDGEGDDKIFEEIDANYSRIEVTSWNGPEAAEEPEEGYEGNKPAQITNAEAIEFGPWDTGHMDDEGEPIPDTLENPDEIVGVFLTDSVSGYTGNFLAYYNLMMGRQVKEGETLRIPVNQLIFQIK